jgi:predicted enzyme related to lactoylglutathione lyase
MPKVSISIDVLDMDEAILFYTKALGCKKLRAGTDTTKLTADNVDIYLLKRSLNSNPLITGTSIRNFDRHWTPVHLDFSVTDLDHAITLVNKFGGIKEGSESGDWGSIAFCADPFGNGFCLCKINA